MPFTVALDPGHGGTNLGTASQRPGTFEKHITMDLARRVALRLGREKNLRVVLCRDGDVLLPMRARVRCANQAGARLFLSLHANASPAGPSRGTQRGFELYVLSAQDVERDAQAAAVREADDAAAVFAAHRVRATAFESLEAARRVRWRLADTVGAAWDRGIKQDGAALDVLQGLAMPAVLVEVGFLDNPVEGPALLSDAGLDKIAAALAEAVTDQRARELRGKTDPWITATAGKRSGAGARALAPPARALGSRRGD